MVFCYKIITESPRRSRSTSPTKVTHFGRLFSDSIRSFDTDISKEDILDSIPDRDWRLLAALARKREEEDEGKRLAEQFQKMWLKEKEERQLVEAETSEQYRRYLHNKRSLEDRHNEYRRVQRLAEQQYKKGQLLHSIKSKEQRSADLLAMRDDQKITEIIGKAVEDEARAQLAAERRYRHGATDEWKKRVDLLYTLKKADDADRRRNAMLRDASQRLAITNALTSWETSIIREEGAAVEAAKRAQFIAQNAMKDAQSQRINQAREMKRERGKRLAALTAQMREAVKSGF